MCTVTYLPSESGYVLTSNRDESPIRTRAVSPELKEINEQNVILPIDGKALGTWIFTTENGITFCLLNGAFEKHKHEPPYRKSRGKIVLDFFDFASIQDYAFNIDLEEIEPFTLIMIEKGNSLTELVWDGHKKHISELDSDEKHLWSSAPLYTAEMKAKRENLFNQQELKTPQEILQFHQIGRNELVEEPIFIKRERVETISTTQVIFSKELISMEYFDYLSDEKAFISF